MWCPVSPANCGVSPDTVCSSELIPAYLVPTAEPSPLCMTKAAFLAVLWLVGEKNSQIHGTILADFPWDRSNLAHTSNATVLVICSSCFPRSSRTNRTSFLQFSCDAPHIVDFNRNVVSTKFFLISSLCHAVDSVTQEVRTRNTSNCNMYGTTQLL